MNSEKYYSETRVKRVSLSTIWEKLRWEVFFWVDWIKRFWSKKFCKQLVDVFFEGFTQITENLDILDILPEQITTVEVESFSGRNIRDLVSFLVLRECLYLQNRSWQVIRESTCKIFEISSISKYITANFSICSIW